MLPEFNAQVLADQIDIRFLVESVKTLNDNCLWDLSRWNSVCNLDFGSIGSVRECEFALHNFHALVGERAASGGFPLNVLWLTNYAVRGCEILELKPIII